MRLFIGIKPGENAINQLAEIVARLQNFPVPVKWIMRDNIHMTIKFIGDVDRKTADRIIFSLSKLKQHKKLNLSISGLGTFKRNGNIRVVYAEVERSGDLENLFNKIEDRLYIEGIEKEKRSFRPHFTLGRTKKNFKYPKIDEFIEKNRLYKIADFSIDTFTLFKSDLFRSGPVYTIMEKFRFN